MTDRDGIFAGDDPFAIAQMWLAQAHDIEPNDANAMALATVDATGMPNVRMVLLKEIESDAFVFYTNFGSAKGQEITASGKAAFVLHWKSLRRQIRVRGTVSLVEDDQADAYFASRSLKSRLGAWASKQSMPLSSRTKLMAEVTMAGAKLGPNPDRPKNWGGFRIHPENFEFWADGTFRLHDRFAWSRDLGEKSWKIHRLYP